MTFEATIQSVGGAYLGECEGLVWFVDPVTQSTHTLPPDELTRENIQRVLGNSREAFQRKSTRSEKLSQFFR